MSGEFRDDMDRLYAPLSTVERYHAEDKAWREAHMQAHQVLSDRLVRVETAKESIDKRLSEGGESFKELRESIRTLHEKIESTAPKPMSRTQLAMFILGPILGLLVLVGSVVWQAARTPDRTEFTHLQEQVQEVALQQASIAAQLSELQLLLKQKGP